MITVVVVVFGYLHTTFLDVVGAGAMASIHTVGEEKIAMVWKKYQKVESDARLKKKGLLTFRLEDQSSSE